MKISKSVYLSERMWQVMEKKAGKQDLSRNEYLRQILTNLWADELEDETGPPRRQVPKGRSQQARDAA